MPVPFRIAIALGLCLLLAGCPFTPWDDDWDDDEGSFNTQRATPIYLSYEELRSSVKVESPRSVSELERVYLFGNYFFLNEKNTGIHIFDNSDPSAPVATGFIAIPGNTELAIKGGYLYADSYVDLVTLDLNDPDNVQVVDREENIFPWNEYQNVPSNVYFDYQDIDRNRGVIVGYR